MLRAFSPHLTFGGTQWHDDTGKQHRRASSAPCTRKSAARFDPAKAEKSPAASRQSLSAFRRRVNAARRSHASAASMGCEGRAGCHRAALALRSSYCGAKRGAETRLLLIFLPVRKYRPTCVAPASGWRLSDEIRYARSPQALVLDTLSTLASLRLLRTHPSQLAGPRRPVPGKYPYRGAVPLPREASLGSKWFAVKARALRPAKERANSRVL